MRVLIVGNSEALTSTVHAVVVRGGFECRDVDVVNFDRAVATAGAVRREFSVILMSADPTLSLAVLRGLRQTVRTPIIAVGPADDPKYILRALREGADAYIDQQEIAEELEVTISNLKTKRLPETEGGRMIGVMGTSGGCGVSTIAANMATALAKRYGQVVLGDMRLGAGDQALFFDVEPTHTLADLCRNASRLDQSMFRQSLAWHSSGVGLLAAPSAWAEIAAVTPDGVRQTLAMARALHPYVVLDLDRTFTAEQKAAAIQVDLLLLVLRLDMVSLQNARRVFERLNEMGMEDECVRLVVNQHRQPKELSIRQAEQALGMKVHHTIPFDVANVNVSNNKGVPLVIERPRSKAAKSIRELADRLPRPNAESAVEPPPKQPPVPLRTVAAQYL